MNSFFEVSKLNITAENKNGKTILRDVFFTAPYKIAKPFPEKDGGLRIIVMTASAGILEGDEHLVKIDIGNNAKLTYHTQSYEKIHRMEKGSAVKTVNINSASGSTLIYFPFPVIPFENSAFECNYDIKLEDDTSKLAFVDIITCGRKEHNESFLYQYYKNVITISQSNELSFYENTCFEPLKNEMSSFGMLEGYTHMANVLLCNIKIEGLLEKVREVINIDVKITGGASVGAQGYIVAKIFGATAESLINAADRITALL